MSIKMSFRMRHDKSLDKKSSKYFFISVCIGYIEYIKYKTGHIIIGKKAITILSIPCRYKQYKLSFI